MRVVGVVFQYLREEVVGLAEVSLGQERFRAFELLAEPARQGFLEPLHNHLLRERSDELVLDLAVHEELDGGYARDAVLPGDGGVLLGVELAKLPVSTVLVGQAFKDGADYSARPTPRGPEVHQHRLFAAAPDHVHVKVVGIES